MGESSQLLPSKRETEKPAQSGLLLRNGEREQEVTHHLIPFFLSRFNTGQTIRTMSHPSDTLAHAIIDTPSF
jgi:hypothetical protein